MAKIPDHAKCVFKGIIFDVYQWDQTLYDGTTTTFEMLKRPDTVVVIPIQGDRVFYAKQEQPGKPPFLSLFGGRSDPYEDPLDAAKRELLEETGLVSEHWQLYRQFSQHSKIDWTVHYFIARDCRTVAEQQLDGGEKIEISSCSIDEFINTIIPAADFREYELKQDILSVFNPAAAQKIKDDILG